MRHKYRAKPGWHDKDLNKCEVIEKGVKPEGAVYYFKSKLEVTFAKMLRFQVVKGYMQKWEYEPEKWDFNERAKKPFRNYSTFTPDFKLTFPNGTVDFWEITGMLYPGKISKLKRAHKLFPEKTLLVVTKDQTLPVADYLAEHKRKAAITKKLREKSNGN